MFKKKQRVPAYSTIIGEGTQVDGGIRFTGSLHVEGKVIGDIKGISDGDCALTLGQSGTIQGSLDVAQVVLDGTVIGDVRASYRAELASGARVEGTIYYGALEMAEGAEVNGKLLHIGKEHTPQLAYAGMEEAERQGTTGTRPKVKGAADGEGRGQKAAFDGGENT